MADTEYPFSFSVTRLKRSTEALFVARILGALGFRPKVQQQPEGLSGLRHGEVTLGVNNDEKHLVVVQAGFDRAHYFGFPRAIHASDPPGVAEWSGLPLIEKEARVLKENLLAGYDLRALYEHQGWACDVLYFMNLTSSEDSTGGEPGGALDFQIQGYSSTEEIPHHPLAELRRYAVSTGTALISLGDFRQAELEAICLEEETPAQEAARQALKRLRVSQYFSPPTDELVLGAVHGSERGIRERELMAAVSASKQLKHPLADNELLAGVDRDDPIDVAKALRREKYISYKGGVLYPADGGAQIWHSIETTPQESWIRRLLRLLPLVFGG